MTFPVAALRTLRVSLAGLLALLVMTIPPARPSAAATPGDWPTYAADNARSGFNSAENQITRTTAARLALRWTALGSNVVITQPTVTNGLIYWGDGAGTEHATSLSGGTVWQTSLGQTQPRCFHKLGLASTGSVTSVTLHGTPTAVLVVGGGNGQLYALNALTGAVIWRTRMGPSPATFVWGSPAVYNGSVYIGIASAFDCPLAPGKLLKVDATTGVIQATFNTVASGCVGGGIWGTPSIDTTDGTLYIATGNPTRCAGVSYAPALLELRLSDLTLLGSWTVPLPEQVTDSDFGSAPTLFTATSGATVSRLVGVANKNGRYYAFTRNALATGPVWQLQLAVGGPVPNRGDGSVAPSAWDGSLLYVAGGNTTINGTSCKGSVRALQPLDGSVLWAQCLLDGPVLGAVTAVPGVVAVAEGQYLKLLDATTGTILFSTNLGSTLWGPPTIANGTLYQGDYRGNLYAYQHQ